MIKEFTRPMGSVHRVVMEMTPDEAERVAEAFVVVSNARIGLSPGTIRWYESMARSVANQAIECRERNRGKGSR